MKRILPLLALLLPLLSFAQPSESVPIVDIAKGIKLAWDASPATNVINHRVLIGTGSGQYTDGKLLGPATSATVMVEAVGDYFLAVTAIDDLGIESGPSNEIMVRVRSLTGPTAPTIRLAEKFEVIAVTETTTTTRIIREILP